MANKGDNLQSFKIADTRKPTVQRRGAGSAGGGGGKVEDEQRSLGFARIERILENEDQNSINAKLTDILDGLHEFNQGSTATKDKAAVKKAMVAIERAADLMEYLFQTKAELENPDEK
jgi:hypothetical protein